MKIDYNVTGSDRKRLVNYIADFFGCESKYLGAPTFAYQVGYITVSKDGEVSCEDHESLTKELAALKDELKAEGFTADEEQAEDIGLTITVPLSSADVGKLTKLLEAKGTLIKKALGIDALPVEVSENTISFPWFSELPDADSAAAYTRLVSALCKMSKYQVRVQSTDHDVENEKYAFRCFLLRLGFIGEEYKTDRRILLKNLSGDASFKNGRKEAENAVSE